MTGNWASALVSHSLETQWNQSHNYWLFSLFLLLNNANKKVYCLAIMVHTEYHKDKHRLLQPVKALSYLVSKNLNRVQDFFFLLSISILHNNHLWESRTGKYATQYVNVIQKISSIACQLYKKQSNINAVKIKVIQNTFIKITSKLDYTVAISSLLSLKCSVMTCMNICIHWKWMYTWCKIIINLQYSITGAGLTSQMMLKLQMFITFIIWIIHYAFQKIDFILTSYMCPLTADGSALWTSIQYSK